MSNQAHHTKVAIKEKMKHVYGGEVEHKHNKDHLEYREHQPSHSGQPHGGEPEGHKHLVNHHPDGHHDKHHKDKVHAHKKSSRLHHKKSIS
ncbi:hypothetical protein A143_21405 [Vibrio splendidus ZS-139]|jgi:hypothetical protein|nr:hypothetical protein A143_21405 [Vibrio splendidus ZS-139]